MFRVVRGKQNTDDGEGLYMCVNAVIELRECLAAWRTRGFQETVDLSFQRSVGSQSRKWRRGRGFLKEGTAGVVWPCTSAQIPRE